MVVFGMDMIALKEGFLPVESNFGVIKYETIKLEILEIQFY